MGLRPRPKDGPGRQLPTIARAVSALCNAAAGRRMQVLHRDPRPFHPDRARAVFGDEHLLYVLNRIAEEPLRVCQALVDLLET